jgi:PAS domain-containing protein
VGVFSRDFVTNSAHWDKQTFRLFGLPQATQPPDWPALIAALHPDDRATYGSVLAGAAVTGAFPDSELRVINPDGSIRHLLVRGRTETGAGGAIRSLSGVVIDITARKDAENRAAEYAE